MSVKNARKLRDVLLVAGFVIMLTGSAWKPLMYVGIVVSFSSLIPHFLYNKCPHCDRQLGRNVGKFCQFCGKSLESGTQR